MVVDCDSHVMEPADLWQRYLEPKFRDRAIRIETRDGVEHLIIGEQSVLSGVLAALGGAHRDRTELFAGGLSYADGCEPASYDPRARAKLLDESRVDRGVLFPTIGILPFPTDDQALANAYCRAYNRWQREFFETAPTRVVPIALLNWHDVDAAAAELKHCIAAGFRGIFVPPETIDGVRPSEPKFDPIWRQCEEADIPGCLRVIVRFSGAATPFHVRGRDEARHGVFVRARCNRPDDSGVVGDGRGSTVRTVSAFEGRQRRSGLRLRGVSNGSTRREAQPTRRAAANEASAERLHPPQLLLRRGA
jgi:hypothetical protein